MSISIILLLCVYHDIAIQMLTIEQSFVSVHRYMMRFTACNSVSRAFLLCLVRMCDVYVSDRSWNSRVLKRQWTCQGDFVYNSYMYISYALYATYFMEDESAHVEQCGCVTIVECGDCNYCTRSMCAPVYDVRRPTVVEHIHTHIEIDTTQVLDDIGRIV